MTKPQRFPVHHVSFLTHLCFAVIATASGVIAAQDVEPPPAAPVVARVNQATPQLPELAEIEHLRGEIETDRELDDVARTDLLAKLDEVIRQRKEIDELSKRLISLKSSAKNAPEATADVTAELKQAEANPSEGVEFFGSPDELQAAKLAADQSVAEAKRLREQLESVQKTREDRLVALPKLIADARDALGKLQANSPVAGEDESAAVTQLNQWAHMAKVQLLQQQVAVYQQEKTTFELERSLIDLQTQLAKLTEQQRQAQARAITKRFASDRILKIRQQIEEFQREIAETPLARSRLVEEVFAVASQWQNLITGQTEVESQLDELKQQVDDMRQDYEGIKGQVSEDLKNAGGLSSAMGLMLQQKRAGLPATTSLNQRWKQTSAQIDEVRSLLTTIGMQRETIARQSSRLSKSEEPARTGLKTLDRLLEHVERDASKYRNLLIDKSVEQQQFIATVDQFGTMIDGHVLWFRSADRFSLADLPMAWRAFQGLVNPAHLREAADAILSEAKGNLALTVAWALCVAALIVGGTNMRRRLAHYGREASRGTSTDMQPTWGAIMVTLVLSTLLPVAVAIPGWRLATADEVTTYARAIGYGLLYVAMFVTPLEMMRQVVRPDGLAVAHFGWPDVAANSLRVHLRWFIDLGLPVVFVWAILSHMGNVRWEASLGRMVFVAFMLQTSWFLRGVMHPHSGAPSRWLLKHRDGWLDRLKTVWHTALYGTPLLLAGLSLWGYSYSAHQLTDQLYKSLILTVVLVLVGGVLRRWAMLNRRGMAIRQIQERAEGSDAQDRSPIELAEHPELDIREANAQTMRLITTTLVVAGLFGFAWIWTSVLPAVQFLNRFIIIPPSQPDGEPFTLGDIVTVVPLIVLTVIAVRNLPGLLETTLLQRLPLDNAARYATKTISSYVMLFAGIMLAARSIGIHWESIQWLVAALGVGLGFGLQEIFANFISGIILLFEQPLRVGDVVTIGDTTGVVSRIRMRATTVTNWDRQELVIPNKDLITGRLVNWTLTDTTNRIVVKVGIAYGTDTDIACDMLRQICADHPNVTADPAPIITFEGFGDSTLDLVIRCYLSSLDKRLETIHQLHTNIHNEFNRAGIEIAFPQRDLNIRSIPSELLFKEGAGGGRDFSDQYDTSPQ